MNSFLDSICRLLYQRGFKKAEENVLSFIESILALREDDLGKKRTELVITTNILYEDFNEYYDGWLKNITGGQIPNSLTTPGHANFLIGHAQKVAEMDDLLFELINYLATQSASQKKEVKYHFDCYKKNQRKCFQENFAFMKD